MLSVFFIWEMCRHGCSFMRSGLCGFVICWRSNFIFKALWKIQNFMSLLGVPTLTVYSSGEKKTQTLAFRGKQSNKVLLHMRSGYWEIQCIEAAGSAVFLHQQLTWRSSWVLIMKMEVNKKLGFPLSGLKSWNKNKYLSVFETIVESSGIQWI